MFGLKNRERLINNGAINAARDGYSEAANALVGSEGALKGAKDALKKLGKDASTEARDAAKEALKAAKETVKADRGLFKEAGHQLGAARGGLTSSITEAGRSMKHALGFGKTADVAAHTLGTKVGLAERIASKPFRIAQKRPGLAIAATAVAAVAVAGSLMHSSAKRRTQEELNAQVNQPVPATATATTTVQDERVTHEDVARMDARMKQYNPDQQGGHVAKLEAAAAAAQQQQAAGSPVAAI